MESKKLRAFYWALGALVGLTLIGALMVWWFKIPWEFFTAAGGQIMAALGIHNGTQMGSDRSANYNPPEAMVASPPAAPTGKPSMADLLARK